MKFLHTLCAALLFVLLSADLGMAQYPFPLPSDAEYAGALLDSTKDAYFYNSGNLQSAFLKADYQRNGITFEAGSKITFAQDSSVLAGMIKQDISIGTLTFIRGDATFYLDGSIQSGTVKAGSKDANLIIPADSKVVLNNLGKVFKVIGGLKYQLLGKTLRGETTLFFHQRESTYSLYNGSAGEPQLIALLPTQRTAVRIITAIPVIVPVGARFEYKQSPQGSNNEIWTYPGYGNFVLNNYNFGLAPQLHIKDFKLIGVTVSQSLTIGGILFNEGEMARLDDVGKVLPPLR